MRSSRAKLALAVVAASAALTAPAVLTAAPASSATVRIVYYDASRVSQYATQVQAAADTWNRSVTNVQLKAGSPATVTLHLSNDWPMAVPYGLGAGDIYIGKAATDKGHDVTRIISHEWGHILGLPDIRTGLCSDLMSGSSAPGSCTNAAPSSTEAAKVNSLFSGQQQQPPRPWWAYAAF